MTRNWLMPRRAFLKGLGTVIALPALEAFSAPARLGAGKTAGTFPKRMGFVYVPNGINMADWTPSAVGNDFELPFILDPLKPVQKDFSVLSGLALDGARSHGDGGGDHARATAAFLTGSHPRKTPGADIRAGVSVDQVAAAKIGNVTRLRSLELACEANKTAGMCDTGYSCAYQANISWRTESSPMPPETDPRLVFERLFGNGAPEETKESRERRRRYRKSILDFVMDDAKSLQKQLGTTDRRKLDEYLTAVRELEHRIEHAEQFAQTLPDYNRPTGIPGGPNGFEEHMRLMFDLMVLAYQTDTTRIASFMIAYDGSDRSYPQIGVNERHHVLSHHEGNETKKKQIAQINKFHLTQFARFVEKLKSIPEGDGTLLDNCMIVYGSGIGDGNAHNHDNLPILLAGRGGGHFAPGRHIKMSRETPLTNLYLTMLDAMGTPAERVGDSTGKLVGI